MSNTEMDYMTKETAPIGRVLTDVSFHKVGTCVQRVDLHFGDYIIQMHSTYAHEHAKALAPKPPKMVDLWRVSGVIKYSDTELRMAANFDSESDANDHIDTLYEAFVASGLCIRRDDLSKAQNLGLTVKHVRMMEEAAKVEDSDIPF